MTSFISCKKIYGKMMMMMMMMIVGYCAAWVGSHQPPSCQPTPRNNPREGSSRVHRGCMFYTCWVMHRSCSVQWWLSNYATCLKVVSRDLPIMHLFNAGKIIMRLVR